MKHQRLFALAWGFVLLALLAGGAARWLNQQVALDTDILALLPVEERDPLLQQAFVRIVDAGQQKLIVLVGAQDWPQARDAAQRYQSVLAQRDDLFASDAMNEQTQQDWLAWFRRYSAVLMTERDEHALRNESAAHWVAAAQARLYSPVSALPGSTWRDDPFGTFSGWAQARAQETPVRPRDGMLHVSDGERDYAVLPLTLKMPAFSMSAQQSLAPVLERARAAAAQSGTDVEVLAAGFVLHAAQASDKASTEMSIIGAGSLCGVILLVWFAFRSLKPIAYILILVAVGCASALALCLLLFDRVHLLTLVFGATLIGVAQDYGIYFLCHRRAAAAGESSPAMVRRLLPGLALTLGAAAIGYAGLAATPFPGLQQMAVFSIAGLTCAWLTVVAWYPAMIGPNSLRACTTALPAFTHWPRLGLNAKSGAALVGFGIVLAFGLSRLQANDDIRALQTLSPQLLAEQIKIGKLLDIASPAQFYLVRGDSVETVLQREEQLRARLDTLTDESRIRGYQALSSWVPSEQAQARRHTLAEARLYSDQGALPLLAASLEENAEWITAMRTHTAASEAPVLEDFLAAAPGQAWKHLWVGTRNGESASIVAIRGVTIDVLPALQQAAQGLDGVSWVDKTRDVSAVMGHYRVYMGWVLAFSYVAIACLLFLRYRASAWRAFLPVLAASLTTLALLGLAGQPLMLFHLLALLLLLGLGVDYGIFFQERSQHDSAAAWQAVTLSAASTMLAFGLLGLSSTPALRAFGLTILIGTTLIWLILPCLRHEPSASTEGKPACAR